MKILKLNILEPNLFYEVLERGNPRCISCFANCVVLQYRRAEQVLKHSQKISFSLIDSHIVQNRVRAKNIRTVLFLLPYNKTKNTTENDLIISSLCSVINEPEILKLPFLKIEQHPINNIVVKMHTTHGNFWRYR